MDAKEILIVAGESSADAHGAALVRELRALHPGWRFYGVGGPRLQEAGAEIVVPMSQVTVMGFSEVIPKLRAVRDALRVLSGSVLKRLPDAAILLDFPDFNLRLAKRLRKFPIPVVYYISPQLWAWREGRVELIRRLVDKMLVILPFEKEFYAGHGVEAEYVGHPLLDQIPGVYPSDPPLTKGRTTVPLLRKEGVGEVETGGGISDSASIGAPTLALLPGSRIQEVHRCLPVMLDAVELLKARGIRLDPCVCLADSVRTVAEGVCDAWTAGRTRSAKEGDAGNPSTFHSSSPERSGGGSGGCAARGMQTASQDRIGEVLSKAEAALVVSGTATLHCALYDVPMVILYKTSWLNYAIARLFVRVPNIGLVNLVGGGTLVPELIQGDANPLRVADAVEPMLRSSDLRRQIRSTLAGVRAKLGPPGASRRAAEAVSRFLAGRD